MKRMDLRVALEEIINVSKLHRHTEIEVRLGKIDDKQKRFDSSISKEKFDEILTNLRERFFQRPVEKTIDRFFKNGLRWVHVTEPVRRDEYCIKKKIRNIDIESHPYDIRVSLSCEIPVDAPASARGVNFQRQKKRYSFDANNFSVDMTVVDGKKFEVEIEATHSPIDIDEFLEIIEIVKYCSF